jgi:hypothetical protein
VQQPLTFYFDRNFGRSLPEALALLKLRVVHHHSPKARLGMKCSSDSEPLFLPRAPDDEWLAFVGQRGWIAFSHDQKFHKPGYEVELAALKQHNVACFYLWGANHKPHEKARCFLRAYEAILETVATVKPPFIYSIDQHGKLSQIPLP